MLEILQNLTFQQLNNKDMSYVKNDVSDTFKDFFSIKFNYLESFALMDGRLAMCGIAVGVAMFALLWDYLYPFPQSRPILIFCVSAYFLMMGILTLYTTYKEKGIFVVAIQNDHTGFVPDNIWEASSFLKKFDDKYNLILSCKNGKTGARYEATMVKSVANFFDENGTMVYELLEPEVSKLHSSLLAERKEK
ncbi:hypothetical protein PR048_021297 [Dryococelus australis]|uniref:Signal peptidase complex subunit 2 n=1 Tax=Dryococelus australis TaxID=614101 RepID=A0ABQ9GXW2_9NEOP|nr:hypothetical protein PR048_021297 [Dryococelus australis]